MMLPGSLFPRRNLLFGAGSLGLAGGLAGLPSLPAMAADVPPSLAQAIKDPKQTLKLYVKMNADAAGKPYYGWFSGHVYGFGQGQLSTPLFGIEGYGLGWCAPRPDGSYRSIWKEVGFYTDLKTGEVINKWRNPYNGVVCDVMHINNRSVNFDMMPVNTMVMPPDRPVVMGGDFRGPETGPQPFTLPWFVHGDTVATTMDTRMAGPNPFSPKEWPRESSGERYSVTEFLMHYASLKGLLDAGTTSVPVVSHWTRICSWLPWMLMGQAPGQVIYRAVSKKMGTFEELPKHLRDYAKANFPNFLALSTPEEQAMAPESSYEVFKLTRKPASI